MSATSTHFTEEETAILYGLIEDTDKEAWAECTTNRQQYKIRWDPSQAGFVRKLMGSEVYRPGFDLSTMIKWRLA